MYASMQHLGLQNHVLQQEDKDFKSRKMKYRVSHYHKPPPQIIWDSYSLGCVGGGGVWTPCIST